MTSTSAPTVVRPAAPAATAVPAQRADEYAHLDAPLARYLAEPADSAVRRRLREQLTVGYGPLARNLASRYRGRREPLDDLVQVAMIGLLNAMNRFDPQAGTAFVAFAIPTITGELRHHFRDRTWATRVPRRLKEVQTRLAAAQEELTSRLGRAPRVSELAHALQLDRDAVIDALQAAESFAAASLDHVISEDAPALGGLLGGLDPRYETVEVRETLLPALRQLSDRDRTIVTMRFFDGRTQTEIAAELGVSQMQVSRLLAATLSRLRRHLDDTDPAGARTG